MDRFLTLTAEAHALYTRSGKVDGRFTYRMYLPQHRLGVLRGELGSPITDVELMLLVHDDGELETCANPKCGREFRPVAGVTLRDLSDEKVLAQIRTGAGRSASETDYGRLAPYIATLPTGEVMEWGSYVKVPEIRNGRLTGWKASPFCGAIYWFDENRGIVVHDNRSCLVAAMKASYKAGFGGHSYSRSSVEASIAASEAKHQANLKQGRTQTERLSAVDDLFGIHVENTPRGREFSREGRPNPPTMGDLPIEIDRTDRSAKRRAQGGR